MDGPGRSPRAPSREELRAFGARTSLHGVQALLFYTLSTVRIGMPFQIQVSVSASLSLSMSQRYTVGCSTPVPHTCVFLWPCSVPWSSTPSPAPAKFPLPTQFSFSHPCQTTLVFPPRYTKFSVCSNSCPSTSRRNFLFPSPRNWHSVFCMLIFMPIFGSLVRLLSTSSVIHFPVRRISNHPQISNLLSSHLRC